MEDGLASAHVAHPEDSVGTVFNAPAKKGDELKFVVAGGEDIAVILQEDIAKGHKVALREIETGEAVIKYGHRMGVAIAPISRGEAVHVHNVVSERGREKNARS